MEWFKLSIYNGGYKITGLSHSHSFPATMIPSLLFHTILSIKYKCPLHCEVLVGCENIPRSGVHYLGGSYMVTR